MEFKFVKIVVFVPVTHAGAIREAMAGAGAGHIGNYDFCSFSSRGIGKFRPVAGAKPFIGEEGKIEEVEEERIEVICPIDKKDVVLESIKKVHPYEEPAIDVYAVLN